MHTIPFEIPVPKNEADFERLCAQVYGVVYGDRTPKINGRKGQSQGGVDVFVMDPSLGRIGIQCKKYTLTPLTWKAVVAEVAEADKKKTPIKKLILATTAANDATLLGQVQVFSDRRQAEGLFTVEVEFWDDICLRIEQFPILQDSYAPNTPGGAYHRQETRLKEIQEITLQTRTRVFETSSLPVGRDDSANRIITGQLDRTNDLLKTNRYKDAQEHLNSIGKDLEPFDPHQKARWHLQQGLVLWLSREDDARAADYFLKAYELYPDDERMFSAGIRGLMLQGRLDEASRIGTKGLERFPSSQQIWTAAANVQLMQNKPVVLNDVPPPMRGEADVLQLIALAALKAGNFDEAIRLSRQAGSHPDAGFFVRAAALRVAVDCGSRNPVHATYGMHPKNVADALTFGLELFQPWAERLWHVQSEAVLETAAHIGYGLLLLRRYAETLAFVQEAEKQGHTSADILRIHVMALRQLEQDEELLRLAGERINEMTPEALVSVAQIAVKYKNLDLLGQAYQLSAGFTPPHPDATEVISALRWEALFQRGETEVAVQEILDSKASTTGSLVTCCVAARVMERVGRAVDAADLANRASALVSEDSSPADKQALAELYFFLKRWADTATFLEKLVVPGGHSELHNRLLACYIRGHNRKRAKALIESFPEGWMDDDESRRLAIELGQQAVDWSFLRPLTAAHVKKYPKSAGAWVMNLNVSLHSSTPSEFQGDLRDIPEELEGTIYTLTRLASLEIRYGESQRGIRRLYRMARRNMDEPEALSGYFICIVGGPPDLPLLEANLPTVSAGSAVTLEDEFGHILEVAFDPADIGELPHRDSFLAIDSPQARALLGAKVKDRVRLPMRAFGDVQSYTVLGIQSVYRRILGIAGERADAVGGLPDIKSVPMVKGASDEIDLTYMQAEVSKQAAASREILDMYAQGALTVARFCRFHGKPTMDATFGWPSDGPGLFVCAGNQQEREKALGLLKRPDANYVIDSLTLAELTNLGVPQVLENIPKVFISPLTKTLLEQRLKDAEEDRTVATSVEIDGQFRLIEHSKNRKQLQIEFARKTLAAAEKYCVVQPAYADFPEADERDKVVSILEDEELEVLLLAQAQHATLITTDGRLRLLLEAVAAIPGVWPQVLLMHAVEKDRLEIKKSVASTATLFLINRTYVSLSSKELMWLTLQGGAYLQRGMQRFKEYQASSDTDFDSILHVSLEFLETLLQVQMQLGAFGEFVEHIVEGLARHPSKSEGWLRQISYVLNEITVRANPSSSPYPFVNQSNLEILKGHRAYLLQRAKAGLKTSEQPLFISPIRVKTLFCTAVPYISFDAGLTAEKEPEQSLAEQGSNASAASTTPSEQEPGAGASPTAATRSVYMVASDPDSAAKKL